MDRKTQALFIEDDEVDQMALKRSFETKDPGFSYVITSSAQEAKEKLASEKYDIIIVDFMLGDGTAFDVLKEIENTPSIILTGQGSVEIAVEALKAGASDYVVKEANHSHLSTLANTIKNTIRNHQIDQKMQMLSQAMMSVSDSVYITDMNHKIIYVNQAFLDVYGYTEEEIIGQQSYLFEGKSEDPKTTFHKRKNGQLFAVSLSLSTVKSKRGVPQYIISIAHDISERNRMEQALLEAIGKYSALLARVEESNEALRKNK